MIFKVDQWWWTDAFSNKLSVVAVLLLIHTGWCNMSWAASAELRANQSPPYYANVPVELVLSAEGFSESPQPVLTFVDPKQGKMTLAGVSPNISSSIQIINGKMSRSKTVLFNYHLRFTAPKPGNFTVGPFTVTQGVTEVQVGAATIEIGSIPQAGDQEIKVVLPEGNIYVGQRLPVKVEWWVKLDRVENLMNPLATVPLFDLDGVFQFYDQDNASADNQLTIADHVFPATVEKRNTQKGTYAVWTVERLMVPLRPGNYNITPASLSVDEAVRWKRDFFGRRTPSQVRKLRAVDQERVLTIIDLPIKGRPESYSGAVGQGFAFEVSADRSVVQVGDPIKLVLTLKGDVEVANTSLPLLSNDLPANDFRVPSGKIAGVYDGETKQFEMSIRVLNESVREIPPLSFSWFDTKLQTYQTTQSRPIALSVRPAKMVSASDVIRSKGDESEINGSHSDVGIEDAKSSVNVDSGEKRKAFSLSGADLSINKDKGLLLGQQESWLGGIVQQIICYSFAFSLMAVALFTRRRSDLDPEMLARQKEHKDQRQRIKNGDTLSEISDAVRRIAAGAASVPRDEIDLFLSECDSLVFAPGGEAVGVDENLKKRALSLAEKMTPTTTGVK
ncbi:MAG: BatD family protein [Pseudomonadales bacterium]|nr:BatD family protein [Pseudomonadales bacterium]